MDAGQLCYKYYKTPVKQSKVESPEEQLDNANGPMASMFKPDAVVIHLPNAVLLIILLIAVISFLWLWWRWT